MNNPQLEEGFIQIASGKSENDILSALVQANLNGTEYQCILFVIRKTWGFKKKEDWISLSQFQENTTKSRKQIIIALQELVNKRLLVKKNTLGKKTIYSPNKNIAEWIKLVKKTTPVNKRLLVKKRLVTSEQKVTQLVNKRLHTKDTITKETNIYNNNININSVISLFEPINPFYKKLFSNSTQRKSLQNIINKYGEEWTAALIQRLPEIIKMPYAPVITSPYELEVKMGALIAFLQRDGSSDLKFKVEKV